MGFNLYEVRGSEVYAVVTDDFDDVHGLPVFEIRGSDVYPTTFNERDAFGLPAFEITDRYAWPTSFNEHDSTGFDVPALPDEDTSAATPDPTPGELAAVAAIGAGIAVGVKAYGRLRDRRARKARHTTITYPPPPLVQAAPPGWYPTDFGPRYWNGAAWVVPVPLPAYPTAYAVAYPRLQAPPRPNGAHVATAWIATVLTVGYMLPWAVAATRGKANAGQIGVITLLTGWTVVGWIVALVMAGTSDPPRPAYGR